jgi:hypothetical protein
MESSATRNYIQNLYKNILQRTGETGETDYYLERANTGMTAADMASGFIRSPEGKNVESVIHLYNVFFNRTPDSAGLAFWINELNSGFSLLDIVNGFSDSTEFQAKCVSTSTADYVEVLYGNLFGRASDTDGKSFWIQKLESGTMSRAEVGLAFTLSVEAQLSTGGAKRFSDSYLVLRASGTVDPKNKDVVALTTKTLEVALAENITGYDAANGVKVIGKIVDGYLSGATVFADANGDGIWNPGEATTITDTKGNFIFNNAKGALIASGGIDLSTGQAFKGVLKAPEGSTMVNPLTSLQQGFIEKGLSLADAELKVAQALGLDASKFNLTTYDSLAASLDTSASPADRALGAQLQAQAAKIANLLVAGGQTLIGAAGGADKLDVATASRSLLEAMVNAISADSDGVVSFSDQAMLKDIMNASVTHSGNADLLARASKVAGLADAFAAMSSASADNVDKAVAAGGDITAMMVNIAQSSVIAQGSMANQMKAAAVGGDLFAIQLGFIGAAFDAAANKAVVGDLNPNSTTDDAAAAASNASAGAPTTSPAPVPGPGATPTEIILVQKLDASPGNSGAATSYIAAGKQVTFHDDVSVASFASITGFGANDAIAFTAAAQSMLAISSQGSDVTLTANNNGLVSTIELKGVISPGQIVFDLTSFNALPAGDITFNGLEYPQNRSLDTAGGTLSNPALLDGANGSLLFIDDAAKASVVGITNFGTNDRLSMQNTLAQELAISSQDTNVTFVVNQAGTVSSVTLVGIVPVGVIVYDVNSFNALSVGDVQFQ